jgi:hypothetical protein
VGTVDRFRNDARQMRTVRFRHRAHSGDHVPSNLAVLRDGHHTSCARRHCDDHGSRADELVFSRNGKRIDDPRAPAAAAASRALPRRADTNERATNRDAANMARQAASMKSSRASAPCRR